LAKVRRPPPVLAGAALLGVGLIVTSEALGLYDRVIYWGKLVHAVEGFLVTAVVGLLLLSFTDRQRLDIHTQILALTTIGVGVTFGAFWEFLEFLLDWVRYSDLQKSNTDTMTDMLGNDVAAVLATLLAFHAYHHWIIEKRELGDLADSIFTPIGRLLDRHGTLLALVALLSIAVYVAALWYAERPLPFVAPQ
jgi:hypothetical protein